MISRLEIIAGAGTVARFGEVCVWAAPQASPALLSFLVDSARNVGSSPAGGSRIADHVAAVLEARDPEPGVGFATMGPGGQGIVVLLHGPVQAWDGRSWLVPQPAPGWLRSEVPASQTIAVSAHGSPPPVPAPGSDLVAGIVPAGGLSMIAGADEAPTTLTAAPPLRPTPPSPGAPEWSGGPDPRALPTVIEGLRPPPDATSISEPEPERATTPIPELTSQATVVDAGELLDALRSIRERDTDPEAAPTVAAEPVPESEPDPAPTPEPEPAPTLAAEPVPESEPDPAPTLAAEPMPESEPDPAPTLAPEPIPEPEPAPSTAPQPAPEPEQTAGDVRPPGTRTFAIPPGSPAPLPPVGALLGPESGQPVVAGLRCPHGHFNHPASGSCVTCGRPLDAAGGGQVSGPRPVLGVLLTDEGAVLRLDRSYLVGSAPESDPTVTGGRARALTLPADPDVAPVHLEIRLTGWTVSVIDRGSTKPTLLLVPGQSGWETLRPFVTTPLRPGTHLAAGPRVLSMISPWPLGAPLT